jgi:PHP family Zn ribbon phosphoesterase
MTTKLIIKEIAPGVSPDYGKTLSGRCRTCNTRFIWPRRLGKLSEMKCPKCGAQLRGTTHMFKGDTYEIEGK